MLPATGSTITHAIFPPRASNALFTAARSLYGRTSVSDAAPLVTPEEEAPPEVRSPEPAFTSIESECPW